MLDHPGGQYWDPEANSACFEAIKSGVKSSVSVDEVDAHINDLVFVDKTVERMIGLIERRGVLALENVSL